VEFPAPLLLPEVRNGMSKTVLTAANIKYLLALYELGTDGKGD
jgi:hypothetical protein